MKNFVLLFALVFTFISCADSDNDRDDTINYYGKWTIVTDPQLRDSPYAFQEFYEFKADSTFIKTRIDNNNVTTTASGTFVVSETPARFSFVLTYSASNPLIIISSADNLTENLTLNKVGARVGYLDNDARAFDAEFTYEKTN